ncbi:hypothetical protein EYC58_03095 [Candidatus Saccharibacteria bacterium]|nr:MAG: hypothetical protein EYC58_03095 [Candidatus Saccharibacteria bacterium]
MSIAARRMQRGHAVSGGGNGPLDRMEQGWAYTRAEAQARSGIARLGLTINDMTPYTGSEFIPAGSTLTRRLFTSPVNLRAGGITITESLFRPTVAGGWNIIMSTNWDTWTAPAVKNIIQDCEITGEALSVQNRSQLLGVDGLADVIGCDIHDVGSGIGIRASSPTTYATYITSNVVRDLTSYGDPAGSGNHSDGFTIREYVAGSGRHVYVRRNWFDCETANASGAMFLQAQDNIRQITFEYNLFDGGGWNFTLGDYGSTTYDDIFVNDNRFNPTGFGAAVRSGVAPDQWTNNYRLGASAPNYAGAVVPMP